MGEVRSGGSHLFENDPLIYFGIYSRDRVEKAEILWPAGEAEAPASLVTGHFCVVRLAKGIVRAEEIRPELPAHR